MRKNKKLKGFTLVELLVVIAILAVLATVSVVGYTSFITKANNSNALTECKQAEDIVLSDLISTGKEVDAVKRIGGDDDDTATVTFKYTVNKGKVNIKTNVDKVVEITGNKEGTDDGMHKAFPDTKELDGGRFFACPGNKLVYITPNQKGIAIWNNESNPASPTDGDDGIYRSAEDFIEGLKTAE